MQRPIHSVTIPPSIWQAAAQETKDRILVRELEEGFKQAKRELEYLQSYFPESLAFDVYVERRNDNILFYYTKLEGT
jgi:hypothetical protein